MSSAWLRRARRTSTIWLDRRFLITWSCCVCVAFICMQPCCVSTRVTSLYALRHMRVHQCNAIHAFPLQSALPNVTSSRHALQLLRVSLQHGFGIIIRFGKELYDSICDGPLTVADSVRLRAWSVWPKTCSDKAEKTGAQTHLVKVPCVPRCNSILNPPHKHSLHKVFKAISVLSLHIQHLGPVLVDHGRDCSHIQTDAVHSEPNWDISANRPERLEVLQFTTALSGNISNWREKKRKGKERKEKKRKEKKRLFQASYQ